MSRTATNQPSIPSTDGLEPVLVVTVDVEPEPTNEPEPTIDTSADPFTEIQAIKSAYATGDKAHKATIRKALKDAMDAALWADEPNMPKARLIKDLLASLTGPAASAPKVIDWNGLVRDQIVTYRHAAYLLETALVCPSNAPDGFVYEVRVIVDENDVEIPEPATVDESRANALASARVGKSGKVGDVGAHIFEVLSANPNVAMTHNQIAKAVTDAYPLPGPRPSNGAVAARLVPAVSKPLAEAGVVAIEAHGTVPASAMLVVYSNEDEEV